MIRRLSIFLTLIFMVTGCKNIQRHFNTNSASQPDSTSGYAPVNGLKMYYEIHGAGQPLVLIHGGGSTIKTTFSYLIPQLAQHFKVIALETQAHGRTSDRNSAETFEQDADDVAALLSYLKVDKAHIFGFSNGGTTALQLAIRHPEKVNKLIAASAVYQREGMMPGFFESMQHASLENMPKPLQTAFLEVNNNPAALQVMHDKDKARMLDFKDIPDTLLLTIQSPVLVINGDKDVVTNDHAAKMARTIPTGHLMILPGNHGSYIGELTSAYPGSAIPALATGAIIEFLR